MCDPPTITCDTCGTTLGPATLAATTDRDGHTTGWAWTTDTDHDCPKEPTVTQTPLAATLAVIDEVILRWPDLVESRIKGTERVVVSRPRDPDEVDEGEGFGELPAPIHLDVLDAMASIVMWADMLHEHVAQTVGHPRLEPAASALADPRPFLAYVRELLPEASESDEEIVDAARDKAERMKSLILAKVGEVFDGQTLEALCPFCIGQTFAKRHIRTLRVRIFPSRI